MFELVENGSSKFWEIWRDGSTVYTRFGKAGAGGQTKLKDEGSVDDAERAIEKQIREKTGKGYVEAGGVAVKRGTPDAGELDAQIAALPPLVDDPAYLVFADWLQSKGDPWGELITVQHQLPTAPPKQRAQLVAAAEKLVETVLGPVSEHSRFVWHLGFLRTATLGTSTDPAAIAAAVDELLARPVPRLLDGLVLNPLPNRFETQRDWESSDTNIVDPWTELSALAAKLPARITHLGFGAPTAAASAYLRMPRYTALSEAFPHLRRLELTGSPPEEPGRLAMPKLVDLEVRFANASRADLDAITEAQLPLERVSVWLGARSYCILDDIYSHEDDGYPESFTASDLDSMEIHEVDDDVDSDDIVAFINALPATVKHLGIQSAMLDGDLVAAIASCPAIKQLHTLDLSGGTLDDAGGKALLAAKKSLAHLQALVLERNRLGAATAKKIVDALPRARTGNQRTETGPELFFRYVATME